LDTLRKEKNMEATMKTDTMREKAGKIKALAFCLFDALMGDNEVPASISMSMLNMIEKEAEGILEDLESPGAERGEG
jgi:hypothetical protein